MADRVMLRELKRRMEHIAGGQPRRARSVLPFGSAAVDTHLPGGGLMTGCLHELATATDHPADRASTVLWLALILARLPGPIMWCGRNHSIYPPAVEQAGLDSHRLLYARTSNDTETLWAMEEGLRHPGMAAVVGEIVRFDMTASRRLQLAAATTGAMAFILRSAVSAQSTTVATSRWRIGSLPSGVARGRRPGLPRWRAELTRCRGAEPAFFVFEASDEANRLALSANLADRPIAPQRSRHVA